MWSIPTVGAALSCVKCDEGRSHNNQKQRFNMSDNIQTIRSLYAAAEGHSLDLEGFLSCFSEDAYVRNVPTGTDFRGPDIALVAAAWPMPFRTSTERSSIYTR